MNNFWDFVIVGGGTAGCVVANRLSENAEQTVLVLEAGPRDLSPYLHVPVGLMKIDKKYFWDYPAEPDPSRHNKSGNWESGKVLGGTSSINGMIWARGEPDDFNEWAALGAKGWDFASVLPYIKRAESFEDGGSDLRGGKGPLTVSHSRSHHEMVDIFVEAARNAGYHLNTDYNGERREGVGYAQVAQKRGLRQSTARAYLDPARRRKNLDIRTGAFVRRILFDGNRAVGVEYECDGKVRVALSRREVILSAGAIGSPKLLMLSGIGPSDNLRTIGILATVDLPGVGHNLRNHPMATMIYEVNIPTLNREFTPMNTLRHGFNLVVRGRGAATSGFGHAVIYGSIGGHRLNFTGSFGPYGRFIESNDGKAQVVRVTSTNAVTIRPSLLHPKSLGTIDLRSANPSDPPVIHSQTAANQDDVAMFTEACRRIRTIFETEPMKGHVVQELDPGINVQSDADWEAALRQNLLAGSHLCGTCKMGNDDMAVVDENLRVRGVDGLRVVDASIMPTSPSGGTYAPTVMIGEYASDLIVNLATQDKPS